MSTTPLGAVWQFVQYLFLFGLVLALAYFATRSLRRLAPGGGKGRHLRLLDQLHLGTSRSFYLLAVANRVVLVAMGEGGVAAVTTLDDPVLVAELLQSSEGGPEGGLGRLAGSALASGGGLPAVLTAMLGTSAAALGQGVAALGKGIGRLRAPRSTSQPDFEALLRLAQSDAGPVATGAPGSASIGGSAPLGGGAWTGAATVGSTATGAASTARLEQQIERLKKLVEKAEA